MKKVPSHCDLILNALRRGEHLTGMDILRRFNCMNYKGRISDLRRKGFTIHTEMIKTRSGKIIAEYSMSNNYQKNGRKNITAQAEAF